MARRTLGPAESPARKRLMVLGSIAVVSLVIVGFVVVVENGKATKKAEQERLLSALDEKQPDFNYAIGPDGKPVNASNPTPAGSADAGSGSANDLSRAKSGSRSSSNSSRGESGSAGDPQGLEAPDEDYPSSGGAGSENKTSAELQAEGEHILMEIQEGATGDTIADRDKALRNAIKAFDGSVKADNENAASYWGLGFSQINLAAGFLATPNAKDDPQWGDYAKKALANAKKAIALSKGNNRTVFDLATTLAKGIDLERKNK